MKWNRFTIKTKTEAEELLSEIKIYSNCIVVKDNDTEIKYEFSDLNKVIKDIRNLVKMYK